MDEYTDTEKQMAKALVDFLNGADVVHKRLNLIQPFLSIVVKHTKTILLAQEIVKSCQQKKD